VGPLHRSSAIDESSPPLADTHGDRIGGPLWLVFGAAVLVAAWRTERMAEQGVPWFGAPGLVPGLLGIALMFTGLLLTLRAWRSPRGPAGAPPEWRILGISLLLCLGFAGLVLGHGPSFGVAAGLYLFLHISFLQWRERRAAGQTLRGLVVAAAVAVGGGLLVPLVFEQIFLVRLP
jgi:hypothetical protein